MGAIEKAASRCTGWKDKTIAVGCDGASVNVGKHRSVTTFLKKDIPQLIVMHCVNHRLELAVISALKEKHSSIFGRPRASVR